MDADPAGNSVIFQLLLLVFFTLMNAFFAGAEMAVVSVNKNRIRSLAEEGNKKAKVIEGLFDDSTKFLSTIQVDSILRHLPHPEFRLCWRDGFRERGFPTASRSRTTA